MFYEYIISYSDDNDDHLRWLPPSDLNLEQLGITHLDHESRVEGNILCRVFNGLVATLMFCFCKIRRSALVIPLM